MMVPTRDASADAGTPDIQTGEKSIATLATLWYVPKSRVFLFLILIFDLINPFGVLSDLVIVLVSRYMYFTIAPRSIGGRRSSQYKPRRANPAIIFTTTSSTNVSTNGFLPTVSISHAKSSGLAPRNQLKRRKRMGKLPHHVIRRHVPPNGHDEEIVLGPVHLPSPRRHQKRDETHQMRRKTTTRL